MHMVCWLVGSFSFIDVVQFRCGFINKNYVCKVNGQIYEIIIIINSNNNSGRSRSSTNNKIIISENELYIYSE